METDLTIEAPKGNYLIIGATGLIGSSIIKRIINKNDINVIGIHYKSIPKYHGNNIKYFSTDLTSNDIFNYKNYFKDVNYIIMAAGVLSTFPVLEKDPVCHIINNMKINLNVIYLSYILGAKNLIWMSSITGYPDLENFSKLKPKEENTVLFREEDFFHGDPSDNYFSVGWTARYTEKQCQHITDCVKKQIRTTLFRPTTVYGEEEGFNLGTCHLLPALIKRILDGKENPLYIKGDSREKRDFIYADDLVDAIFLSINRDGFLFEVYNIGNGENYSIEEIVYMIKNISGTKDISFIFEKNNGRCSRVLDLVHIKESLCFKSKTSLKRGIEKLVTEYRRIYN